VVSQRQRRDGLAFELYRQRRFISIVDAAEAPYSSALRQLGLSVWCTTRVLPLTRPLGVGKTDFILAAGAPAAAGRCLAGPSQPYPSFAEGSMAWRLLNQLSLNYLSLIDSDPLQGAAALREMLALYCHPGDLNSQRQVEGVRSISSRAVTRRVPSPGPITVGRGIEITVTFDDAAFEGTGAFLLGAVLSEFFAQYVDQRCLPRRWSGRLSVARSCAGRPGGACAILVELDAPLEGQAARMDFFRCCA
jgi:type VI secretion system protein ImpG